MHVKTQHEDVYRKSSQKFYTLIKAGESPEMNGSTNGTIVFLLYPLAPLPALGKCFVGKSGVDDDIHSMKTLEEFGTYYYSSILFYTTHTKYTKRQFYVQW